MKAHEPRAYFPGIRHPGYLREEIVYTISHAFQGKRRDRESLRDGTVKVQQYIQRIIRGWRGPEEGYAYIRFWEIEQGTFSEEAARAVIDAVKEFGLGALRPNPLQENILRDPSKLLSASLGGFHIPYSERRPDGSIVHDARTGFGNADEAAEHFVYAYKLDELGAIICEAIRLWQYEIRFGTAQVKRRATRWLQALFKSLTPETRGKRDDRPVTDPMKVKFFYYSQLFRLHHVKGILTRRVKFSVPGNTAPEQNFMDTGNTLKARVSYVSENFDIPRPIIRELFNLDDYDQPRMRPVGSVNEMARILTARRFRISQHTVSNIIAS